MTQMSSTPDVQCRFQQLKLQMAIFENMSRQALQTLLGTALVKFATGIIAVWGTINLYYLSYLKNHGESVDSKTNSILMFFVIVPASLVVLLATRFSYFLGYKTVIRVSAVLFTVMPLMLNFKFNFYTLAVCFLFFPMMCFSLSAIPIINCLWSQFPKDLNKVSGAAILFFSLGMVTWNIIFFRIVNPNNLKADIDSQNQAYFGNEITDNLLEATNVIFLIAGCLYIPGSFLIQKKIDGKGESQEELKEEELKEEEFIEPQQSTAKQTEVEKTIVTNSESAMDMVGSKVVRKGLLKCLKDKKFLLLFGIAYLVPLYLIYLTLFMKIIFMPIINDDGYLAMCAVILTIAGMIRAPFWGIVADRKGFKKTLLLVCLVDLATKSIGLFCSQKWNIVIMYFMIGFNDRGIITIIGPGLIQIFGLEMATQLAPYKGFSMFMAYLTVPMYQLLLSNFFSYKGILAFFIAMSLVAVFLAHHFYSKMHYEPYAQGGKDKPVLESEGQGNDLITKA